MPAGEPENSGMGESDRILPRVGRGDSGAMTECMERYSGLVWSIARKYCANLSDAEDLTQEIFTELWRKASRYDSNLASEATFIGMLARRRSIDLARRKGRQPAMEPISHEIEEMSSPSKHGGQEVDRNLVMEAVAILPSETRDLFRFHFESGMTHQEISTRTGIPLGTVKTRLRTGLMELRKHLTREAK